MGMMSMDLPWCVTTASLSAPPDCVPNVSREAENTLAISGHKGAVFGGFGVARCKAQRTENGLVVGKATVYSQLQRIRKNCKASIPRFEPRRRTVLPQCGPDLTRRDDVAKRRQSGRRL